MLYKKNETKNAPKKTQIDFHASTPAVAWCSDSTGATEQCDAADYQPASAARHTGDGCAQGKVKTSQLAGWHGARVNGGSNHDPLNIGCGTLIAPTTKILTARPV